MPKITKIGQMYHIVILKIKVARFLRDGVLDIGT